MKGKCHLHKISDTLAIELCKRSGIEPDVSIYKYRGKSYLNLKQFENAKNDLIKEGELTAQVETKQNTLVIKGFYIGMNKERAEELKSAIKKTITKEFSRSYIQIDLEYDENNSLRQLSLSWGAVDYLFNTKGISFGKFRELFLKAYNIPDFEMSYFMFRIYYTYESDQGWKLELESTPVSSIPIQLILTKTTPTSEIRMGD